MRKCRRRRVGAGTKARGNPRWLAVAALVLQGCSLHGLERAVGVSPSIQGEVLVRGSRVGELTLRPEACLSGDRGNFRGVDLVAPPLVLRLAAEPIDGLAVAVIDTESGERRGVFRRADCEVLRGDVQRTGWLINQVQDVSGFVEVDCRAPSGEEIEGSITFTHCH